MNLQKKLIQLSEYKCSFKYVDSYFLVSVTYPESWSIMPSEDRSIEVAEENGVTFYAAPIETDIDTAFSLIDDTIAYNLDVEKKMALLKYNIGKLQELFAEKDLEELETIEFVFKSKKKEVVKSGVTKRVSKKTTKKPSAKSKSINEVTIKENEISPKPKDDSLLTFDNCLDETMIKPITLEANNEPVKTENKYLEEVDR